MEIEPRSINDVVLDVISLQADVAKALTSQDKTIKTMQETIDALSDIIDIMLYRIGKVENELS